MGRQRNKKDNNIFRLKSFCMDNEVTGSCMQLSINLPNEKEYNILLDFGLIQNDLIPLEQRYRLDRERLGKIKLSEIDTIVLSHANFDHISALPLAAQKDEYGEPVFNGRIITTQLTSDLTSHILRDGVKIMETETNVYNSRESKNVKPLYTKEHVEDVINMTRGYSYNTKIWLKHNICLELLPSGHIAGSCLIYITYVGEYGKKKHFMYCPDMYYGDSPRPYTKSIEKKCYKSSMVVLEATYGNKPNHPKESPMEFLEKLVLEWVQGKNNILWIPTFSMQRSTQLCYILNEIYKKHEDLKDIPIYNIGKLTKQCHSTIGKNSYIEEGFYDEQWCEDRTIFDNPKFIHITDKLDVEHFVLNNQRKIVLSSSGAITNGFSSMIGDSFIANKKVGVVACGYIFPESTLDKISKMESKVIHNGREFTRRCTFLGTIPNLSGHVSALDNVKWAKSFNQKVLKVLVLSHGMDDAKECLKDMLYKEIHDVRIVTPKFQEVVKC